MASKTDIGNWALIKLGEPRVSNIDTTDTKPARTISQLWDQVVDAALQAYPWKFAGYRTQLAADATAPIYDWAKAYTVPSDYLALRAIRDDPAFDIEGGADETLKIVTDVSAPLYIRYTRRITNTGQFHPLFNQVLACDLALNGCESITESNTKKEGILREKLLAISQAYAVDAIETPSEELPEDSWLEARA